MEEIVDVKSQLKISLPIAFESLINILMTLETQTINPNIILLKWAETKKHPKSLNQI